MMNDHYVYYYRTPVAVELSTITLLPGAVFYVGKGKNKRYLSHLVEKKRLNAMKHAIIDRIRAAGFEPEVCFVSSGLTNDDAKRIEIETIS